MGLEISMPNLFDGVKNITHSIMIGPPRFIQLNETQKQAMTQFIDQLEITSAKCDYLKQFADKILQKNDNLFENKKFVLANSAEQIKEVITRAKQHGFIANTGLMYFTYLFEMLQQTINQDIVNDGTLDLAFCGKSIWDSVEAFRNLRKVLQEKPQCDQNVVWVFGDGIDKWKVAPRWDVN